MSDDLPIGDDGLARCRWGAAPPIYVTYHDTEWGRPTFDERTLFEKLCLEGFQAGLSWLTILRKRERFRERFANFDAKLVAEFTEADILSLLDDPGIIRHRGKIEATINNAKVLRALWETGGTLSELIWAAETPGRDDATTPGPATMGDVPATTERSVELSKSLKSMGFRFVGPTTAYAAMQAMGVVNDHLEGCSARKACWRTAHLSK